MKLILLGASVLLLSGCNFSVPPEEIATPSPTSPKPTQPPATETSVPVVPTKTILELSIPEAGTVLLDFVAQMCSATWSNSIRFIPCPGNLNVLGDGFIGFHTIEGDGTSSYAAPALLTIAPGSHQGGLFGRYPAIKFQNGDKFRAALGCMNDCNLTFSLSYYNTLGQFFDLQDLITLNESNFEGYKLMEIPLDILSGQTVELVLTLRELDNEHENEGIWFNPYIYRDPNAQSGNVIAPTSTSAIAEGGSSGGNDAEGVPGTIAGWVDVSTAPPYLNDPVVGPGPVAVVFYNLNDGTWRWVHTTLGNPNFQTTVTPGAYHVVAYAIGFGGVPYITGAYTGGGVSCGAALQNVIVGSNQHITNIVITEWDTSCGDPGDRPPKPDSIPLP